MQFEINEATVKQLAWSVKNALGHKGHDVPSTAILEALSKGFGFESYRAIRGVAAIPTPSKFLPLVRELMKGDPQISVYFDVNYIWTEHERKRDDYPIWAKLLLTEDLLVRLFELQEEVEANRSYIFELTLDTKFELRWENSAEKDGWQEVRVGHGGMWAKLDFGSHGTADTRFWFFENMQHQLRERKPTEPVYVEVADKAYVLATDPDIYNRYLVAEGWSHCFAGSMDSHVDFVYDTQLERIIYMRLHRALGYERTSHSEIADVEDSLKNANAEALESPEDWGLEGAGELPGWAQKYAADDHRRS